MTNSIDLLREALAGRYEIEREIGQGAYATVYRALDLRHDRLVAIKVLNVDPTSDMAELRFVREIKWLARLQHPNILPLHDSGHVGNLLYFITPYLSGESLGAKIQRERRLAVHDALRIAHEIADALQYAHGCGVVHRDIKPDNILLSGNHAIVADFGVARAIDTARGNQLTRTGPGSPGTPAYMSPEQLLGGKEVDQRSDVYSLGCVLYEMLIGKPPFAGKDGFVRRFTEAPPSVRQLRPELSALLDEILTRALAPEPTQRHQTALELARDLDRERSNPVDVVAVATNGPAMEGSAPEAHSAIAVAEPSRAEPDDRAPASEIPATPRMRSRRWWTIAGATFVAMVGAVVLIRPRSDSTLDDNLLAVAPFSLFGADTVWREGLTDVLVRNLDGAGPLRTVATATSLQHWNGYSDPTSAENLGRALRSRFVVFGSVIRAGRDSVRVSAAVMDVREHRAQPTLQWQDASMHMDRLSDSVTFGMLRQIGEKLGVRSLSHLTLGSTTNVAALKEFLQGEHYFRQTAWDSAFASYKRATALDSTFALALWRVGVVDWWRGPDDEANEYKRRAGLHNHGLGARDSLLIAADYLVGVADSTTDDLAKWNLVRELHATLAEATRRYADDAEAWWAQGDAFFHFPFSAHPLRPRELLDLFQHVIALDSSFAPPYLHAIEVAFQVGDDSLARRLIDGYLELRPSDYSAGAVRLLHTLIERGVTAPESQRALMSASLDELATAYQITSQRPDSTELSIVIGRRMLANANASGGDSSRSVSRWRLAHELEFRGHLREAYRTLTHAELDSTSRGRRLYGDLAILGVLPADSVRLALERWRRISPVAARWLLAWLAHERDAATIRRIGADAAAIAAVPVTNDPARHTSAQYTAAASEAYLALANGDTTGAVRLLDLLPDSLCAFCYMDRWMRVQLLRSVGRPADAARRAVEPTTRYAELAYVLLALEQARAAVPLHDLATAKDGYRRVVALWRRPDPELAPYVREARCLTTCRGQ